MKNTILMIIFISPYWLISVCFAQDYHLINQKISLNFHRVQTSFILQALAEHQRMNLILDDPIDELQTIKLNDLDWYKVLDIITANAKLQYRIEDNLLIISPKLSNQLKLQQQRIQQQELEASQPLLLSHFKINHIEIKSLLSIIEQQKILSDRGRVFIDERSNTLIANDIEQNIPLLKSLIDLFDIQLPQIHISAHIVTMSSESADELGIKWGYLGSSSQTINQFDINLGVTNPTAVMGFNLARRSGNLLNLELSALEAENQLEIIASPNLLTAHQHTASIKQGTEIPYEVSNGRNGSTSIEFKQAVLGLEVTPRIIKNNQLELTLHITQNTAGRSIKRSDGGEALAIDTQEIRTQVIVNSGETLILGGIFQQRSTQDKHRVPGVSHIPIIGELFQYQGKQLQKRELVIFITPHLLPIS